MTLSAWLDRGRGLDRVWIQGVAGRSPLGFRIRPLRSIPNVGEVCCIHCVFQSAHRRRAKGAKHEPGELVKRRMPCSDKSKTKDVAKRKRDVIKTAEKRKVSRAIRCVKRVRLFAHPRVAADLRARANLAELIAEAIDDAG